MRMLTGLLEIPSSAITERDVIRMLGAETGDLVGSVVRVVDIYIGTSAENKEALLAKTLEFFNKVLGRLEQTSSLKLNCIQTKINLSANFDERMNIRSLVKGRSDICVTETTLFSLLHLNTSSENLASDSFQTLSFILTAANVDILLGSSQHLCFLLNTIEDFLENVSKYSGRDITPGLRLIETLISPKLQVHRSISNQILRPLVRLFRGYPFDIEGEAVSRILKIVRDILSKSSPICVSTFFSSADISSDLDYLKKNLLEADSRTILKEIFALNHSFHPSVGPKMKLRRQASANTIKAKLVDDDNPSSQSPVKNRRQQFSAPAPTTSVPHPRRVSNRPPGMATSPKRHNPHSSSSQVLSQPAVFRSLHQEAGQEAPNPALVKGKEEVKPGEIIFRRSKETTDINENDILEEAIQLFQRTNPYTKNEETDAGGEIKVESPTVSQAGKGLFDWMIDDDSDSSTDENIQEQLKPTNIEVPTELNSRIDEMNKDQYADLDMEKLNQWNDDDVFAKTIQSQKPVEETFNGKKPDRAETPTCYRLTRNQLLSVKHSVRVELCEAERFFEIDVGFLATQICGMLNTVNGGRIFLGVKRNGIIKGVRLDWKQRDKVYSR